MYGIWVVCKVKPGMGDAFYDAALGDREGTRTEPGNLRFDVMRAETPAEPGEPEVFYLLELYRSKQDFAVHQQTPHYARFRDDTVNLMAEPRQSMRWVPAAADPWE